MYTPPVKKIVNSAVNIPTRIIILPYIKEFFPDNLPRNKPKINNIPRFNNIDEINAKSIEIIFKFANIYGIIQITAARAGEMPSISAANIEANEEASSFFPVLTPIF